tara:strand:- start:907 stop:1272 length:366 start_codon:yes stop_codon:yes gene_type:complete
VEQHVVLLRFVIKLDTTVVVHPVPGQFQLVHLVPDSNFGVLVLHQEVVAVAVSLQLVAMVHMLLSLCQLHLETHTLYVLVVHIVAMQQEVHQIRMDVLHTFREMDLLTSVQKVVKEISNVK